MGRNLSISSFKATIIPILIVILFLGGEVIYRYHYFGIDGVLYPKRCNGRGILTTDFVISDEDSLISWKLAPNVDGYFKGKKFNTNAHGYRERPFSIEKPSDKIRIGVLGRSITMGAGVHNWEIYTRQLQNIFEEYSSGEFEVLNFAVGGYNLNQISRAYDIYIKDFDLDLVLLPIYYSELEKPYNSIPPPLHNAKPKWTNLRGYLSYTFIYEAVRLIVKRNTNKFMSTDWISRIAKYNTNNNNGTVTGEEVASNFINNRFDEGITTIVVSLLRVNEKKKDLWPKEQQRLKNWIEKHRGAFYIDTHPALESKIKRTDFVYYGDNHPNTYVHKLYAEAIFNQLEPLLFHRSQNDQITIGK